MTTHKRMNRPARHADLEALPENVVGEIVDGELHVSPRPASRHTYAAAQLGGILHPLRARRGGPPGAGWWILGEPELHLGEDVLVPDLAGWRVERMPEVPDVTAFTLPPDWVCEVLSPSTRRIDRVRKMPKYARAGIAHCWLIDVAGQTLEVFALVNGAWTLVATGVADDKLRAPPFEEIELDLAELWAAPVTPQES
jgi:Uma2 family endonuclease